MVVVVVNQTLPRPSSKTSEMFHFFNRNKRLVKSLTRTSIVRDKESEARETLPNSRNSYNEHWRERQRRKVKGDAKNIDVENRWREISKVNSSMA